MTDAEILRLKFNLEDSLLDEKGKEELLTKTDAFHDIFSLRDKIGTCPFIEVHLKLKDECKAIRNLKSPKTLKQTRAFCGMVNFLSPFLPNLQCLLILIYDLQKKSKSFKWTQEVEKAFKEIKELLISLPILRALTPEGLF